MKQDQVNWVLPKKIRGRTTPRSTYRLDPIFTQAMSNIAALESDASGANISQATLIFNLMQRDSRYLRGVWCSLWKEYQRLKKEKSNAQAKQAANTTRNT